MNIIKKQGVLFVIDETKINVKSRTNAIKNALYAEVYTEFLGAIKNPKYSNLTPLEKFNKMNEFAEKWLKARGYLNV